MVMAYKLNPKSRIHVWYYNPWGEARNLEYFERGGRDDPLTQIRHAFADKGGPETVVHLFTNDMMGSQRGDVFRGNHECATKCSRDSKYGNGCCVSWTRMYAYTIANRFVSGMEECDVEYVIKSHDTHLRQNADTLFARGEITLRHYLEAKRLPIRMLRKLLSRLDLMNMNSLERVISAAGRVRSAATLEKAFTAFRNVFPEKESVLPLWKKTSNDIRRGWFPKTTLEAFAHALVIAVGCMLAPGREKDGHFV